MGFHNAMDSAVAAAFSEFGVSAVFSPSAGDDVSCTVIYKPDPQYQPDSYDARVFEVEKTIKYQFSEIDRDVVRGETFTIGSTTYTVTHMTDKTQHWGRAAVKD